MADLKDFSDLVDSYYAKVFYHCVKLTKNNHDAADITQNAFTKAFINLKSLKETNSFGAWIFAICNNEIKLFYRNRHDNAVNYDYDTANIVQKKSTAPDKYNNLYSAIDVLEEKYKNLIVLKYFSEFSVKEISTLTGTDEKLVKSRLYDARKKLKNLLSDSDFQSRNIYNFNKERKKEIMSTAKLLELGSNIVPQMSIWGQKELLKCAEKNEKFSDEVLSELAKIEKGNEFTIECGGKLSYDEFIKILAHCNKDILYGLERKTEFKVMLDIADYLGTGGYVADVEVILYVPSIKNTVAWYKKYLNWDSFEHEDESFAVIRIFNSGDMTFVRSTPKFTLRKSQGEKLPQNAAMLVWIQGYSIEKVRERIIKAGWEKISDICDSGFGAMRFIVEDLNRVTLEFLEWKNQ